MKWPYHYTLRLKTHLANLLTLDRLALNFEYRQKFRSSPNRHNDKRIRTLIAFKMAADDCRKLGKEVPPDILGWLSLMKERDRV